MRVIAIVAAAIVGLLPAAPSSGAAGEGLRGARDCGGATPGSPTTGRASNLRISPHDRHDLLVATRACLHGERAIRGPLPGSVYYGRFGRYDWALATFATRDGFKQTARFVRRSGSSTWRYLGPVTGTGRSVVPCPVLRVWQMPCGAAVPPRSAPQEPRPRPSPVVAADVYLDTGGGHWIQEVNSNGAVITLEDGSLWRVDELDRIDTALWLPVDNITVLNDYGDHYRLVNTDEDGEVANATYLGQS
jgi:hypothetical protein